MLIIMLIVLIILYFAPLVLIRRFILLNPRQAGGLKLLKLFRLSQNRSLGRAPVNIQDNSLVLESIRNKF